MRRRRTLVTTTAAAAVVSLVGLVAVAAVQSRANERLMAKNDDLTTAQQELKARNDALLASQRETATERDQKANEAAKATAINRFLVEKILVQADPKYNKVDDKLTVLQALDNAAKGISGSFPGQQEVEAEIRMAIGDTYFGLGAYEKARDQHRAADEILRQAGDGDGPAVLKARAAFGYDLDRLGHADKAQAILESVVATRRRVSGRDHPDTLMAENYLAVTLWSQGRYAEAEALQRELLGPVAGCLGRGTPTPSWRSTTSPSRWRNEASTSRPRPSIGSCWRQCSATWAGSTRTR